MGYFKGKRKTRGNFENSRLPVKFEKN